LVPSLQILFLGYIVPGSPNSFPEPPFTVVRPEKVLVVTLKATLPPPPPPPWLNAVPPSALISPFPENRSATIHIDPPDPAPA